MGRLYGDFPTVAGRIKELFVQLFDADQAVKGKARQELPKWMGQEKGDVQYDRDLYHRELSLRANLPSLPEEQVAAKEVALDRQIAEQTRLLLQLKSKRRLWASDSEAGEASASADQARESLPRAITQGEGMGSSQGVSGEKNGPNGPTKPSCDVESTT